MGKQLKTTDILGALAEEDSAPPQAKPAQRRKRVPTPAKPDMNIEELKRQAELAAEGKPSPYQSDLRAKLRDKVQLNFANVPRFISDSFDEQRQKAGMNKREYLYHLLRKEGADIPPYEEMDGRKL